MARNTTRLQYEQKMGNLLSKYWGAPQMLYVIPAKKLRIEKLLYFFSSFLLSFLLAYLFRFTDKWYERGTDTHAYIQLFIENDYYFIDYGFIFFSKFIHFFTSNPQIYLFSIVFIINFLSLILIYDVYLYYKYNIKKINLSYFVLIIYSFSSSYLLQVNALRQGLGLPFALFSVYYSIKKQSFKSYIFLLIACSMHWSYTILLVAYFCNFLLTRSFKKYIILIILFEILLYFLLLELSTKLNFYLLNKLHTLDRNSTGIISPHLKYMYLILVFLFVYINSRKLVKLNKFVKHLMLFYCSFLLSISTFISIPMVINRYFLTGEVFLIFILPLLFIKFEKKSRLLILCGYILLISIFLLNFPTMQEELRFTLKGLL